MNAQHSTSNSQRPMEKEKQKKTPPLPKLQQPKKRKTLTIIAIIFFAIISALVIAYRIASHDILPGDMSDLALERPEVADDDNAFTYFSVATNTQYKPKNKTIISDYISGSNIDENIITEIIVRNKETFITIEEGTLCDIYLAPGDIKYDTPLRYIQSLRTLARLMALKTRYARLNQNYTEATDTCITMLKFSDLIMQMPETLIQHLVGESCLNITLNQISDIATDENMPVPKLKKIYTALFNLNSLEPGLIRAFKTEYKMNVSLIDELVENKSLAEELNLGKYISKIIQKNRIISSYIFKPNETKSLFAKQFRQSIKEAAFIYADISNYEDCIFSFDRKLITRPNGFGRILFNMLAINSSGPIENRCKIELNISATRLIIACNIYKKENSEYPENLDQLVPKYTDKIPRDPYNGKPLSYSKKNGIVYSVGKNLKDDNGSTKIMDGVWLYHNSSDRYKKEDIVFNVTKK